MPVPRHVVFCFDVNYLRGFLVAARSLAGNWAGGVEEPLTIHCIWHSCSQDSIITRTVGAFAANAGPHVEVQTHVTRKEGSGPSSAWATPAAPAHLRVARYISEATQLRLYIPEILAAAYAVPLLRGARVGEAPGSTAAPSPVLYLDCDVLVAGDVSWIFRQHEDIPLIAACDNGVNLMEACWWNGGRHYSGSTSFNAGVMLMNTAALLGSPEYVRLRTQLVAEGQNDQSVLNLYMQGTHVALPPRCNLTPEGARGGDDVCIVHWNSFRKPWKIPTHGRWDALWSEWDKFGCAWGKSGKGRLEPSQGLPEKLPQVSREDETEEEVPFAVVLSREE
jgi:lipopolysaccharide biosynthesis glycosyltransferase